MDDLCVGRDVSALGRIAILAIRIIFVEHVELGFHPFLLIRTFEACAAGVVCALHHVPCVFCCDQHNGVGEVPAM
jgi:hypothetical protein